MVIDIPRALLIREPWTTMASRGKHRIKPLIVSLPSEHAEAENLALQISSSPENTNTRFRVIDKDGPCYEFEGTAALNDDVMTVHVASNIKFLR